MDWDDSSALLAPLRNDPFEDDNGYFLVREAAGHQEDEEGQGDDLFASFES
jgi:hypothetical protein